MKFTRARYSLHVWHRDAFRVTGPFYGNPPVTDKFPIAKANNVYEYVVYFDQ